MAHDFNDFLWVRSYGVAPIKELDHVEATLAALDLRYCRLGAAELLRKLVLRYASTLSGCD